MRADKPGVYQQQPGGRWPANVIHDGSEEVLAAFPNAESGKPQNRFSTGDKFGKNAYGKQMEERTRWNLSPSYTDFGSAARFFYQVKFDNRCSLCDATIAVLTSTTKNILSDASALDGAVGSLARVSGINGHRSLDPASNVAISSPLCHRPKVASAQSDAQIWPLERIVQNVSSAAELCSSCATAIAHALAEVRRSGCAAPVRFNPSIGLSREKILSRCLASYVENRESTDTILTIENLSELFGCVFYAIGESISLAKAGSGENSKLDSQRLFYSSKADSNDRIGSRHPTVKPLDLMQYLVRLVTPPHGLILDPFAGTGTTAEAAWREGFSAILIEREPEYLADIERRMGLCLAGPDERARESIKARLKGKQEDHGPLFSPPSLFNEAAE